jgi:hypothetical protein
MDEEEKRGPEEGDPSTGSGRTDGEADDGSAFAPGSGGSAFAQGSGGQAEPEPGEGDGPSRIHPAKGRALQAARTGGRKLFDAERRQAFLEWFAATANVSWSAEKAGVCQQTVWKHRMNDPVFAEAFDRALDQAIARGRARLLETKKPRIDVAGDLDAPEPGDLDPQAMLAILREHERGRGGPAAGLGRKQGRRPRIATNAEVRAALIKRLAAYGVRIFGEPPEGGSDGSGALRDGGSPGSSPGSPPPQDERER